MALRSHQLEELFGGALDSVSYADIVSLIGKQEAAEAEDLDYEQQHYDDVGLLEASLGGERRHR